MEHLELQPGDVLRFCQHNGKAENMEDELPGGAMLLRCVCKLLDDGRWLTISAIEDGPVDPQIVTQTCVDRFAKKVIRGPESEA